MKQSFSLVEAAKTLNQKPEMVETWIKRGQLPAKKVAGTTNQYIIYRKHLTTFCKKHNLG